MKFIFWTNVYDGALGFTENNTSLQDLSEQYEMYFMSSGEKSREVIEKLYNGHIIDCSNDTAIKGKILFDMLKNRQDYDVLVRIDMDAIVFNLNKLTDIIESNIVDKHAVLGNYKKFKTKKPNQFSGVRYVRGACQAATRSVIDRIDMVIDKKAGFDIPYAMSFCKTNCEIIKCKLFELSNKYRGKYPVWHPKEKGEAKLNIFLKEISKYGKS